MPIVTKKRHVDQETGQMVEGSSQLLSCSPLFLTLTPFIFFISDWDLVFADDERESNPTSFKFMQMAHAWKQAQKGGSGTGASKLLSGFTPAAAKEEKIDKGDDDESDEHEEAGGRRVQRSGGGDDVSSSEDEDED